MRSVPFSTFFVFALAMSYILNASGQHPERRGIGMLDPKLVASLGEKAKLAAIISIDERKSLFVTDIAILENFKFDDVMARLARDSGDPKLTKETLFVQWWDTANKKGMPPNPGLGLGPNCEDKFNDFKFKCPRAMEGAQVKLNPFGAPPFDAPNPKPEDDAKYFAIALSNRFDLAGLPSVGGEDCGEYRIVFARRSGINNTSNRNLIIFEAVLPNPKPNKKDLTGCLPVQQFWAALTKNADITDRAKKLRQFYFDGIPGFAPVVRARHYGNATRLAKGQIRTNQFMEPNWLLREFRVAQNGKKMTILQSTVKSNPAGLLFDETNSHSKTAAFRSNLLQQVKSLSVADLNKFGMPTIQDTFNSGESDEMNDDNSYVKQFAKSPKLAADIQKALGSSKLTPQQIVKRAQALSCAGCHDLSNGEDLGDGLEWPKSMRFVHQSEKRTDLEVAPGELQKTRFGISQALRDVFLPFRKSLVEKFLGS